MNFIQDFKIMNSKIKKSILISQEDIDFLTRISSIIMNSSLFTDKEADKFGNTINNMAVDFQMGVVGDHMILEEYGDIHHRYEFLSRKIRQASDKWPWNEELEKLLQKLKNSNNPTHFDEIIDTERAKEDID